MSTTHDTEADADPDVDAPTLQQNGQRYIRIRPNIAEDLPPYPETWQTSDRAFDETELLALKQKGIIRRVEKIQERNTGHKSTSSYWIWQTTPAATAYIADLDLPTRCPRGNYTTGVQNVRNEDGYTCGNDDCDCQFDRDRAETILDR